MYLSNYVTALMTLRKRRGSRRPSGPLRASTISPMVMELGGTITDLEDHPQYGPILAEDSHDRVPVGPVRPKEHPDHVAGPESLDGGQLGQELVGLVSGKGGVDVLAGRDVPQDLPEEPAELLRSRTRQVDPSGPVLHAGG